MAQRFWLKCYNRKKVWFARYEAVGYENAYNLALYLLKKEPLIKEIKIEHQYN